mgnify:CR=1 FL=1
MVFPASLDSWATIAEDVFTDDGDHLGLHNDTADVLEALEIKLGTGASTAFAMSALLGTDDGMSKWIPTSVYNVVAYGATGNGATDDTEAIQSAIDAAIAAGGGTVYFPKGTYKLTASLVVASANGIALEGPAGSGWAAMAGANGGAILNWAAAGGANPMLIIRAAVGSGNWPAHHVRVEDLSFQGNDVATQCIHIEALKRGVFRNLTLFKVSDAAVWVGGTSVSGYIGNQHTYNCDFINVEVDQAHGAATGRAFSLGQTTPDARFFFGNFINVSTRCSSGTSLDCYAVDHVTFIGCAFNTTAPNYSVIFQGQAVNYNLFLNLWPGTGGLWAKGAETGTNGASGRNLIVGYSTSDSAPLPRRDRGAGLVVIYLDGRPEPLRSLVQSTNSGNANYYVKVATGSLTVQYEQQSASVELASYGNLGAGYFASLDLRVQQNSAINGSNQPVIDLLVQPKQGWVASDFSIVVTNVTTTVDWELWVKLPGTYTTVLVTPKTASYGHINWLETQTPASAVSAGTATAGTHSYPAYAEGTWTPTITFATPGDLAVSYSTRVGRYTRIGRFVFVECVVATSAFTHSTASGSLSITGLPFTVVNAVQGITGVGFRGWTDTLNWIGARPVQNTTTVDLVVSETGQALVGVQASQMPSGGTVDIRFQLGYVVS